jgi:hypothetical protein
MSHFSYIATKTEDEKYSTKKLKICKPELQGVVQDFSIGTDLGDLGRPVGGGLEVGVALATRSSPGSQKQAARPVQVAQEGPLGIADDCSNRHLHYPVLESQILARLGIY